MIKGTFRDKRDKLIHMASEIDWAWLIGIIAGILMGSIAAFMIVRIFA